MGSPWLVPEANIYLQHVDAQGQLPWGTEARVGCGWPYTQKCPQMGPDGQGGFFVGWNDWRPPYSSSSALFINHFNSEGHPLWGEGGFYANTNSYLWQLFPDGAGGLILYTDGPADYNQVLRYDAAGNLL